MSKLINEVNLYYLRSNYNHNLFKLLNLLVKDNINILISTNDKMESESLDEFLWTAESKSFLPHRLLKDGFSVHERIYITNDDYINIKFQESFDFLIISPNVKVKKLINSKRFFLFSYFENENNDFNDKKNLEKNGFKVKSFLELENQKWKTL